MGNTKGVSYNGNLYYHYLDYLKSSYWSKIARWPSRDQWEVFILIGWSLLGSNSEAQAFLQRDGQVIIRMRGLPFDATAKDVVSNEEERGTLNRASGEMSKANERRHSFLADQASQRQRQVSRNGRIQSFLARRNDSSTHLCLLADDRDVENTVEPRGLRTRKLETGMIREVGTLMSLVRCSLGDFVLVDGSRGFGMATWE